jgi:hypothetical protein
MTGIRPISSGTSLERIANLVRLCIATYYAHQYFLFVPNYAQRLLCIQQRLAIFLSMLKSSSNR